MNSMFLTLLNLKAQEEARFTILSSQGPFELRMYQRMLCARISVRGSFEEAVANGIRQLDDYLEGNNLKVDRITNAGPYFQVHHEDSWDIGIILPREMTMNSTPMPLNRSIRLEEIPPGRSGVLRFNGNISKEIIHRRGEDLKKWLQRKGLIYFGDLRVARHDLTIPLPFFRNNEIQLDVM